MKISEIFEARKDTEQLEKFEEKNEKVRTLKNTFEEMMSNNKVRKGETKSVTKRKVKKPTFGQEKFDKPQRKLFENWGVGGSGVKRKAESESEGNKRNRRNFTNMSMSDCPSNTKSRPKNIPDKDQNLSRQEKVEEGPNMSRHSNMNEMKQVNSKFPENFKKIVQKDLVLREKVKIWDSFCEGKWPVVKDNVNTVRGEGGAEVLTEKNEEENRKCLQKKIDRTRLNKIEGNCLRGQNSLHTKRAKNMKK